MLTIDDIAHMFSEHIPLEQRQALLTQLFLEREAALHVCGILFGALTLATSDPLTGVRTAELTHILEQAESNQVLLHNALVGAQKLVAQRLEQTQAAMQS